MTEASKKFQNIVTVGAKKFQNFVTIAAKVFQNLVTVATKTFRNPATTRIMYASKLCCWRRQNSLCHSDTSAIFLLWYFRGKDNIITLLKMGDGGLQNVINVCQLYITGI